jgi:hypothetical protein
MRVKFQFVFESGTWTARITIDEGFVHEVGFIRVLDTGFFQVRQFLKDGKQRWLWDEYDPDVKPVNAFGSLERAKRVLSSEVLKDYNVVSE